MTYLTLSGAPVSTYVIIPIQFMSLTEARFRDTRPASRSITDEGRLARPTTLLHLFLFLCHPPSVDNGKDKHPPPVISDRADVVGGHLTQ